MFAGQPYVVDSGNARARQLLEDFQLHVGTTAGGPVIEKTERTKMAQKKFRLSARISSDNPSAIEPILERLISGKGKSRLSRMASKLKQILKEKARETSIACYCQRCAKRRREPESTQNGLRAIQSERSSITCQRELGS